MDALINAGAVETSGDRRRAIYARVQQLIMHDAPAVLLYTRDTLVGMRADISGLVVRPDGALDITHVTRNRQSHS